MIFSAVKNLHFFIFGFSLVLQVGHAQNELSYATLSEMGLDDAHINQQVDSIMALGIRQEAFPGAQVLVAKNNQIVFHKAFGFHTYDSVQAVGSNDIYDLASVTKITAPLPAIMKLVDEGKLDLDAPFSNYWKAWAKRKDKKDLTLRQILSHQAGLTPYIIFLNRVMKNDKIRKRFIRTIPSKKFNKTVYDGLFIKNRFQNKVHRIINRSKVSPDKTYKYSGLTFLIFPQLIEQISGMDYEDYLKHNFYKPMGCETLGFNPSKKDYPNNIVPTEVDTFFRKTLTRDWVHDENAALLGGVSRPSKKAWSLIWLLSPQRRASSNRAKR